MSRNMRSFGFLFFTPFHQLSVIHRARKGGTGDPLHGPINMGSLLVRVNQGSGDKVASEESHLSTGPGKGPFLWSLAPWPWVSGSRIGADWREGVEASAFQKSPGWIGILEDPQSEWGSWKGEWKLCWVWSGEGRSLVIEPKWRKNDKDQCTIWAEYRFIVSLRKKQRKVRLSTEQLG